MNTSEVLDRAADLIEERGWTRGGGWVIDDPTWASDGLCLEGGIMAAAGLVIRPIDGRVPNELFEPLHQCPAYRAVSDYLGLDDDLWTWNDLRANTAEEVIEVLRAAAVIEAAKENESADVPESVSA